MIQKGYVQCGAYHNVVGNQNPQVIVDMVKKIDALMFASGGRPHLAKLMPTTSEQMRKLYPALTQFQQIRRQFDPYNLFYTQRLADLFG